MGLFDNLKNVLSGKKDDSIAGTTKAPSQVLKENGVDPGGLKFAFASDGTVTVSGQVRQEADKARINKLLLTIPGIKQVKQDLSLATTVTEPVKKPVGAPAAASAGHAPERDTTSPAVNSYTVQPGDTLWKIAKQFYGEGNQYLKIFEANKGLLKNPDHIFPGQELVIPKKPD